MKAAGVFMVVLAGVVLAIQMVTTGAGAEPFASPLTILWTIVFVGGLIVWSLQQIREALIGGHPRDVKAGVDARGYKKPRWSRSS